MINRFDEKDLHNFIKKTAHLTAEEIILEIQTQAEFEFDEKCGKSFREWHIPEDSIDALKNAFVKGAEFGMLKVLERLKERGLRQ